MVYFAFICVSLCVYGCACVRARVRVYVRFACGGNNLSIVEYDELIHCLRIRFIDTFRRYIIYLSETDRRRRRIYLHAQ